MSKDPKKSQKRADGLFGQIALKLEILTKEKLQEVLELQRFSHDHKPLGVLLMEMGYVTEKDLERIVEAGFRIYSDRPKGVVTNYIGLGTSRLTIGDYNDVLRATALHQADEFVIGILLVMLSLYGVYLSFRKRQETPALYLSFSAFAMSLGWFFICLSSIGHLVIQSLPFRYFAGYTAFLLFPFGLYAFYEQIIIQQYQRIFRRLWQFHLLFGILALFLSAALLRRAKRDAWPRVGPREIFRVLGLVGVYAVLDEWHQSVVPRRDSSALDVLTDLVGAACVLWIVAYLGRSDASERGVRMRLLIGVSACVAVAAVGVADFVQG